MNKDKKTLWICSICGKQGVTEDDKVLPYQWEQITINFNKRVRSGTFNICGSCMSGFTGKKNSLEEIKFLLKKLGKKISGLLRGW